MMLCLAADSVPQVLPGKPQLPRAAGALHVGKHHTRWDGVNQDGAKAGGAAGWA